MDRALLVLGGLAIAAAVAALLGRRPSPPAANTTHVPRQLDRAEFVRPEAAWLVAVFTSATCNSCAGVWERARQLASDHVAVTELEVTRDKAIHDRYLIDSVPTLVICDAHGAVRSSFLGPVTATELWAAMAEIREPGSVPPGCVADNFSEDNVSEDNVPKGDVPKGDVPKDQG